MTQAQDSSFPQTPSGSLYPKHYVVGVIDNLQEAREAVKAFEKAGYNPSEIRLFESQEAVEKIRKLEEEKNWLQRFLSSFQDTTDETGVDIYRLSAEQGKQILHVRAHSDEDIDKISTLMMKYHAHTIKFFSPWSVSDIGPRTIQHH